MQESCLNHFVILGKNQFVLVVNKGVIGGHVRSKEMYELVLKEACNPCRKRFVAHHYMCKQKYDSDSHRHRIGLALHPATWDDSNRSTFERIKAKLTFKWPKTLTD